MSYDKLNEEAEAVPIGCEGLVRDTEFIYSIVHLPLGSVFLRGSETCSVNAVWISSVRGVWSMSRVPRTRHCKTFHYTQFIPIVFCLFF